MCKSPNCKHKRKAEKICTVPGCGGTFRVARGLCNTHWLRWKRGDKTIQPQESEFKSTAGKVCSVDGCELNVYAKGLCGQHYQRKLRNGSEHDVRHTRHGTIKDARPDLFDQLVNKADGEFTLGCAAMVEWICQQCGEKYFATVASRAQLGTGHQDCARLFVGKKNKNPKPGQSLADLYPEKAAMLLDQSLGKKLKPKSHDLVWWKCPECGEEWQATVDNVVGGTGCSGKCMAGKSGYKKTMTGFFYFLEKPGMLQIGITNNPSRRVHDTHARNGWRLVDMLENADGRVIRQLESAVKNRLAALSIDTGRRAFRKKFDGWSESWFQHDLYATSICDLLGKLGVPMPE